MTASLPQQTVVILADDTDFTRRIIHSLERDDRLNVAFADNAYDGGRLARTLQPGLLILSGALDDLDLNDAVRRIRGSKETARTKVICLAPDRLHTSIEADICLSLQPDAALLLSAIYEILGLERFD